ncbi:unnamed protein product [Hermetia illucens]|uniref:BTB domain-containing protein n=2 Tax=Hermetia illucens TaxID=343691 RepID=A0A7R8UQ05_HERIL|nr:uncharacterized protein DDB_G0283357 isoform X2 [Hermetia illucens]CAD7084806.1 unnamed protein product [Hermetia illucens]
MDDEFALCWNNFQDNIAAGFQNLYDRGDLVDVTLACDGKLLQAHKIVLAICSPYFQEMFITNPCKHPIIVLKDVGYSVMSELLQFMYQGVVNVKHTELSSFMKIAQTLQIKGLATSTSQKSPSHTPNNNASKSGSGSNSGNNSGSSHHSSASGSGNENQQSGGNVIETKINSSIYSMNKVLSENQSTSMGAGANASSASSSSSANASKRINEYGSSDPISLYGKRPYKRNSEYGDNDTMNSSDSMDHMSSDEVFMPPIPQISMIEPKFDLNNVKRELSGEMPSSPGSSRNCIPPPFNFDYNLYQKSSVEYPNELHMSNDYPKGAGNHMDIPPAGSAITMLSSTSLLHGNCIFNRNNTVATQQGMKTYWLCKSYRISMCRARCITHQGRVISATGIHNHPPHIKGPHTNDLANQMVTPPGLGLNNNNCSSIGGNAMRMASQNAQHPHHIHLPHQQMSNVSNHQLHHHSNSIQQANNAAVIQNMMQNVFSQNNLMHLSNITPMLNSIPSQSSSQLNNFQAPSSLQITPIMSNSPTSRSQSENLNSPAIQSSPLDSPPPPSNNDDQNSNHNHGLNLGSVSNTNVSTSSVVSVASSPAEECPSVSQDSNNSPQSNMISTITLSPTEPSFKMEAM